MGSGELVIVFFSLLLEFIVTVFYGGIKEVVVYSFFFFITGMGIIWKILVLWFLVFRVI